MRIEHDREAGKFVAYGDEGRMGELAYENREGDMWAMHTNVDKRYQGHGVGGALLDEMAAFARENKQKIVPICSFVAGSFERHPQKYAAVAK